ncbi:MAG: hypothetical protein HYV96_08920 [Opitutae bacterium]|nr:hypothetical protein [Opitutae bacterium]
MTSKLAALLLFATAAALHAAELETAAAPGVRLNQIQVVGTHNSYHLEPSATAKAWRASPLIRRELPALAALAVEYSHVPLTEQLERLHVRQLELDLHLPAERGGEFPVRHLPVFDERSSVPTFTAALREVRAWSRAHPRHVPIFMQLELKTLRSLPFPLERIDEAELRARLAALPTPREWAADDFTGLEAAIRDVFSPDELITPDFVRGEAPTLRDAIRTHGWPLLDAVRGRVMFTLDNEGNLRDRYLDGAAGDGRGRLLFVSVPPEHPAAAWAKLNDPVRDFARIQELVRAGFIVRTRADEELREAKASETASGPAPRNGDIISPLRRDRAFASGAQIVSTDFPEADRRYSDYAVRLPDSAVVRPNPVNDR